MSLDRPVRRTHVVLACGLAFATSFAASFARADEALVRFDSIGATAGRGYTARPIADGGARIEFDGQNDADKPVSFNIASGKQPWDLSGQTLVATVRNTGPKSTVVRLRAENADANALTDACEIPAPLLPGESRELRLRIVARPADPTYAPFKPFMMYFKNISVRDNTVDPRAITTIRLVVDRPEVGSSIELSPITVSGNHSDAPVPFFPFVDQYGQYIHSEWFGKIHSDDDFKVRRDEEARERADWPGPGDWDKFGGWSKGPTLKATGYFRVEKHEGKWWLVDPDGKLFWSNGPTGVSFGGDVSPITGRENWFKDLPAQDDPKWKSFFRSGRGATYKYYQDKAWVGFDVARANLVRKYGPDYEKAVAEVSHDRLRSWGFNTVGNWSSPEVWRMHRTPYTVPINSPGVSVMRWTDGHSFADVYDPQWEPGLYRTMERERGGSAGDPWCIGYFVDNERCVGWRPRAAAVGEITLKAPADQPAKAKLIERVKAKYATIEKLNAAWKTTYASWDAMRDARDVPPLKDRDKEPIMADLGDFGMAFCERYFSVSRDAVKSVAPDQMFLGSRFYGHTDPAVVELASKYWDLISYNVYDIPPDGRVNNYRALDLPIMITEWGVGSDPTQTPFRGEDISIDPKDRVKQIELYLTHAMRHPNIVGAHFFQYRDQPITGRPDGEATLRGYVNIVDTPNFELVQTNRRVGYGMYETRAKKE